MVHITSKRLENRKRKTVFKVYSNGDSVALFVNGKEIKTISAENCRQKGIFIFKSVKLEKGGENKVKAVAKANGKAFEDAAEFTAD